MKHEVVQARNIPIKASISAWIKPPTNPRGSDFEKKYALLTISINIIVRIDTPKSIQVIDDYIHLTDAIYFSRSDLNLKDYLSKICFYQKSIVNKCGYLGKENKNLIILIINFILRCTSDYRRDLLRYYENFT